MATSQLELVRKYTQVEIDSLDVEAAKTLGPFAGCTSNQGIVYAELSKESNLDVVKEAVELAAKHQPDAAKRAGTAIKIATVILNARMLPHITGTICTQSSMRQAFSTEGTVADAVEIIEHFKRIAPQIPTSRVAIKIPSTWEGLQAAKILREKHNINCLGTTLFSLEQAVLAHEVGCQFISPYLNELKSHFVPGFVDESKLFGVIKDIHQFYGSVGSKTQLLPASFRVRGDILPLVGVPHMSVPVSLLKELSETTTNPNVVYSPPYQLQRAGPGLPPTLTFINDEAFYKLTINRKENVSRKIMEAINVFFAFELQLEALVNSVVA